MAWRKVKSYQVGWIPELHQGRVYLILEDVSEWEQMGTFDPQEFGAILDLLRNEKPLHYRTDGKVLWTGLEPPGEGELD